MKMTDRLSEQELQALFHKHLPADALPAAVHERLQQRVLAEVTASINLASTHSPAINFVEAATPSHRSLFDWLTIWLPEFSFGPRMVVAGMTAVVLMLAVISTRHLLGPEMEVVATAQIDSGAAIIIRQESGRPEAVANGSFIVLEAGDELIAQSSTVKVEFSEGQVSELNPGARLLIDEMRRDEQGDAHIVVTVQDGLTTHAMAEITGEGDSFEVRTLSDVTVVAHGGADSFIVDATSDSQTVLTTVFGSVDVAMGGETVNVQAASRVVATAGQPLVVTSTDEPLLPAPTAARPGGVIAATATQTPTAVAPTQTATQTATATNVAATVVPASPTLISTFTASPTLPPTLPPTFTPTVVVPATITPTATLLPTDTPFPTNTPQPTATEVRREPTSTPMPEPTATPLPTATPTEQPSVEPVVPEPTSSGGGTIPPAPGGAGGGTIPPLPLEGNSGE